MTSIAALSGTPTFGSVNSSPPFSFKSSSSVGADYSSKPSVSALANPTLHNKVPEAMVNGTARAPLFVRPFTRGFEKHYSEGDLLFVRRGDERAASHHNIVANLPVFNYLLRTEKEGNDLKYSSLDKILDDWNYYGIFNNDMDTGSKWQRLLNINVRGRSRVARLWTPKDGRLKKGDCVFIGLVRKTAEKQKTFTGPNGIRDAMKKDTVYYEAIPMMDCCDDYKIAEYTIPVGIVSQVTLKRPFGQHLIGGRYVTETCKLLERIEVLMRI
jgi:hypothetical protein